MKFKFERDGVDWLHVTKGEGFAILCHKYLSSFLPPGNPDEVCISVHRTTQKANGYQKGELIYDGCSWFLHLEKPMRDLYLVRSYAMKQLCDRIAKNKNNVDIWFKVTAL